MTEHGLTRYKKGPDEHGTEGRGCRCQTCTAASNTYERHRIRMIAYGTWGGLTDPAGTRRRLQALAWNGWTMQALSARLGAPRLAATAMTRKHVRAVTAEKVAVLYDELWDKPPPGDTHQARTAACTARRYARERGWAGPWAWDDEPGPHWIDDPAARPAPGWRRREAS